jgi:hypothetical protein
VPTEVDRDHAQICEQRKNAKPVRGVARQSVEKDDGLPAPGVGVGKSFRVTILGRKPF